MISLELSFYACLELVSMHMSYTAVKIWKSMLKIEDHQPRLFEMLRRLFGVCVSPNRSKTEVQSEFCKGQFQSCEDCLTVFINCMRFLINCMRCFIICMSSESYLYEMFQLSV